MRRRCSGVGKALASEHTEVGVVRVLSKEEQEGCSVTTRCAGTTVQQIGSGVQRIGPERGWHGSMNKQGAHAVI